VKEKIGVAKDDVQVLHRDRTKEERNKRCPKGGSEFPEGSLTFNETQQNRGEQLKSTKNTKCQRSLEQHETVPLSMQNKRSHLNLPRRCKLF